MSRKSRQICTKTWHLVLFVFLPCSRNFLSTIFGIFGKFRIDIVKNKFEKYFFKMKKNLCKKPKNIFSRLKKCRKKFYENVNENRKFQNFDFFFRFSKKNIFWFVCFPSFLFLTQNFPRNPKIILRKAYEHFKNTKSKNRLFCLNLTNPLL